MNERAPDSKSKLLAAAAEEFARHGPRGARVAEIVRRAGVNERMIYHHFGSKDGLYRAVIQDQGAGLLERWLPYLDRALEADSPREGLRRAYLGYFLAFHARPLFGVLVLREATQDWAVRPPLTSTVLPEQLRELFRRAERAGVLNADLVVCHAIAISALTVAPSVRGPLGGNRPEIGERIVDVLLDGMIGKGGEHDGHGGADHRSGADRADAGG